VLAIAIAKSAKASVLASDIDPVAVRVARENIRLNGVAGYVETVVAGDLARRCFKASGPYDLIVANILAEPLMALAPQISRCLAPDGYLVLSGLLPEQRARVVAAYRGLGLPLSQSSVRDGWLTLLFHRGGLHRKGKARGSALSALRNQPYQGYLPSMPSSRVFRSMPYAASEASSSAIR
jgi:ribosomal protein L11 methyltransferase